MPSGFGNQPSYGFKFKNAYDLFKDFMHDGFFDEEDYEFFGLKKQKGNFGMFDDDDFFSKGFGKGGNQFGTSKSVTTTTKIINGKKVSTTKTITKGSDGVTKEEITEETVEPNGKKEIKYYVNGKAVTPAIKNR